MTDEGDPWPVALVLNTREARAFIGVGRCFMEWCVPRTQEIDGCLRARWMDCLGAASGLLGCWWEKLRVCGPEFAGPSQTRGQECRPSKIKWAVFICSRLIVPTFSC